MRGLGILFSDELIGFAKSKVMLVLWAGMPLITILLKFVNIQQTGGQGEIPATMIAALIISSIGGTLSSAMLVVSIIHEKSKSVFDLFLIKPIKRSDIILSKFFAVFLCVSIAAILSLGCGLIIDILTNKILPDNVISSISESLVLAFSVMAISCSTAVLIGVASNSVLVGIIAIIYGGNQLAGFSMMPVIFDLPYKVPLTFLFGIFFCSIFLFIAVKLFNKKQF